MSDRFKEHYDREEALQADREIIKEAQASMESVKLSLDCALHCSNTKEHAEYAIMEAQAMIESLRRIMQEVSKEPDKVIVACTPENPCCDRRDEYNGFGSDGPLSFTCPVHCTCHD